MPKTMKDSRARRWLMLGIGLLAPFALEWGLRTLRETPSVKPWLTYVNQAAINTGGYYYTDVEETAEADVHMRTVFGRR